jgi:hypothetical protein
VRVVPPSRLLSNWRMPCRQCTGTDLIGNWKTEQLWDCRCSQTCGAALRRLKRLVGRSNPNTWMELSST